MGTFMGHVLPGSFFVMMAIHWTVEIWLRFFRSRGKQGGFVSTATYPFSCLCGRLKTYQVEGCVKIILCVVGLIGEIATGFRDGKFVMIGNGQHITMYSAFIISGIVDILLYHKVKAVPKNADYLVAALAFAVEGVLFKFHLHGRSELDIQIHTLMVYVVFVNVATIIIEMQYPHSICAALGRAYFVILQGTWFFQVAFILYNPLPNAVKWNGDSHEEMMITTIIFAWHALLIFVFMIVVGGIVGCVHRKQNGIQSDDLDMESLLHTDSNGQTMLQIPDSEQSDMEYEKPILINS